MNNGETLADRLMKKKENRESGKSKLEEQKPPVQADSGKKSENETHETESVKKIKPTSKKRQPRQKEEKEKFYTYMSASNYEEFEEMFIQVRKAIARKTGKKLKVTNMAELAIILAKKHLFDKDKMNFIELVEAEVEQE